MHTDIGPTLITNQKCKPYMVMANYSDIP